MGTQERKGWMPTAGRSDWRRTAGQGSWLGQRERQRRPREEEPRNQGGLSHTII